MENPSLDIRGVVKSITEPRSADVILANVDKYFTKDAIIVHPLLNSVPGLGREGVKSAYKMLRTLTIGNKIEFHTIGFDRIVVRKGKEKQTALLVRVDLEKGDDDLWYITRQEDNLPTDYGTSGPLLPVPGLATFANYVKWTLGFGTHLTARIVTKLGLFK
ncbi:hypothetical protein OIO90_002711 [Microbotryomycetes sp. JL221]|nr:hypothetical protein OIO90_002711 [Microbotryomycetes sp. JL221]